MGESLRDSSASLGALIRDAVDIVNILPPAHGPASSAPERPAATPVAAAAEAVTRAKARLTGLLLEVVEEGKEAEAGRPPFRVGPRTVVLAMAGER